LTAFVWTESGLFDIAIQEVFEEVLKRFDIAIQEVFEEVLKSFMVELCIFLSSNLVIEDDEISFIQLQLG